MGTEARRTGEPSLTGVVGQRWTRMTRSLVGGGVQGRVGLTSPASLQRARLNTGVAGMGIEAAGPRVYERWILGVAKGSVFMPGVRGGECMGAALEQPLSSWITTWGQPRPCNEDERYSLRRKSSRAVAR